LRDPRYNLQFFDLEAAESGGTPRQLESV
jgi:hypothetical protein